MKPSAAAADDSVTTSVWRLEPEELRRLRDAAAEEVLVGVRRGEPAATLRAFLEVVDEADRRLHQRAEDTRENRLRVAATRSPTARVGRTPG